MSDIQRQSPATIVARLIVPLLYSIAGICGLLGIVLAFRVGFATAIAVTFCGVGALAASQILVLLKAIEGDLSAIRTQLDTAALGDLAENLAAIRSQMGMGVLGLLGGPWK